MATPAIARARLCRARAIPAFTPYAPAGAKASAAATIAVAATSAAAATWPDFSDGNLGPDSPEDNLGPDSTDGNVGPDFPDGNHGSDSARTTPRGGFGLPDGLAPGGTYYGMQSRGNRGALSP